MWMPPIPIPGPDAVEPYCYCDTKHLTTIGHQYGCPWYKGPVPEPEASPPEEGQEL